MESIEQAEKPRTGRARNTLFRRLVDIVSMPSSGRLTQQDRHMAADILLDMLFHADNDDRALCARRLAESKEAPRRLLRYLAQCPYKIAAPLLELNEAFDACDLRDVAMTGTPDHRLAIAKRKIVPGMVSDYLADAGEDHVLKELVVNRGAELPEQAIDKLVRRSRDVPELCPLIAERLETIPSHALTLFWWADGATRKRILQRYASDRLEIIDSCKDVFEMMAEEQWADPVARKAIQLIERRQRNRAALERSPFDSLESAINAAALNGMDAQTSQEIGYLSGVKPVTAAKILGDEGGEALAVLCKATGVKRDFLPVLWVALQKELEIEEGVVHPQFKHVSEVYELLSVAKAQTILRYWNWALSSAYSPGAVQSGTEMPEAANEEAEFSAAQRTARLVFGR
ncbi:DUF2336 domain-containing protein [Hyphomonas sp.]|uniref:DUF2336 domain-containing protein n=1 Tax=Hyphomonas sp. TaxID=87 RepID=UPI003529383A